MSDFLKKLAAGPLCDPGKIFLPEGRRRARAKRTPDELEEFRAERTARKERAELRQAERLETLFRYYAASNVPLNRIIEHIGIDEVAVRHGLARHGRKL